jgi:hypothetical protein
MKALCCRLIRACPAGIPDHGTVLANLYGKQGNSPRIGRVSARPTLPNLSPRHRPKSILDGFRSMDRARQQ